MGQMTIEARISTIRAILIEQKINLSNMKKRAELLQTHIPRLEQAIADNENKLKELENEQSSSMAKS